MTALVLSIIIALAWRVVQVISTVHVRLTTLKQFRKVPTEVPKSCKPQMIFFNQKRLPIAAAAVVLNTHDLKTSWELDSSVAASWRSFTLKHGAVFATRMCSVCTVQTRHTPRRRPPEPGSFVSVMRGPSHRSRR